MDIFLEQTVPDTVLVYKTLSFIEILAVKLNSSASYVTLTQAFCFQVSNKSLEQQPQTPPPHWQGPCRVAVTWLVPFENQWPSCRPVATSLECKERRRGATTRRLPFLLPGDAKSVSARGHLLVGSCSLLDDRNSTVDVLW